MSSIQGFNFDKEKLDYLLGLFQQGQMSKEQTLELKYLLEQLHKGASNNGDLNRAREIASILITLKGMLSGRLKGISFVENVPVSERVSKSVGKAKAENPQWPNETCEECGKRKVYPYKDSTGQWTYPRKHVCVDCLEKRDKKL